MRASAASCPRSRRAASRADRAGDPGGARRCHAIDAVAVTTRPGLIGALLVGVSAAKALAWARRLPLVPVNHLHGHVASLYLKPLDLRAAVHLPARERRPHDAARRARARWLPRARHDARRRRRRGVRQGRAPARPRLSRRAGDRRLARDGDPEAYDFPVARVPGPRLLVLRAQDRAALRRARPRAPASSPRGGPILPRATSGRSSARSSNGSRRRGADRVAVVGGVAANSELRAALPGAALAPLPLCTDNAAMIASAARYHRPRPVPRVPFARCASYRVASQFSHGCSGDRCVGATVTPAGGEHDGAAAGGQLARSRRRAARRDARPARGRSCVLNTPSVAQRLARVALRDRGAGALVDGPGLRRAEAGAAEARSTRHDRATRLQLRTRARRLLRSARSARDLAARSDARGRRRLPGAGHIPGVGLRAPAHSERVRCEQRASCRRAAAGLRRTRRHDRAPRHRRRRSASLPARAGCCPASTSSATATTQQHARIRRTRRRLERHGTELAGILVGSDGPGGLHGVAPGATVLPIRVAGWQPAADGRELVFGRSDQLIAGLDRAVDPNGDGDAHDAVRVALLGVAEPYAAFTDGPEAQAVQGALDLNTLVVTPAGNDGGAGPTFGSVAGPAGAPGALAVGATDCAHEPAARPGRPAPRARRDPRRAAAAARRRRAVARAEPSRCRSARDEAARRLAERSTSSTARGSASSRAGRSCCRPVTIRRRPRSQRRARVRPRSSSTARSLPPGSLRVAEDETAPAVVVPTAAAVELLAAQRAGLDVGISIGGRSTPTEPGARPGRELLVARPRLRRWHQAERRRARDRTRDLGAGNRRRRLGALRHGERHERRRRDGGRRCGAARSDAPEPRRARARQPARRLCAARVARRRLRSAPARSGSARRRSARLRRSRRRSASGSGRARTGTRRARSSSAMSRPGGWSCR